ncbi:MAG: Pvc16 family protein [Bacteroidota bacterium]
MLNDFYLQVKDGLNSYINLNTPAITPSVVAGVGNIANFETEHLTNSTTNLWITIIRIEEETSLKNFPNQKQVILDDADARYKADKRYPKIYLNYYLLFSATLQYDFAVAAIHRIIRYFQTNNSYRFNSDGYEVDLRLELFSPTFEQLNQIWATLGGKQYPHVIYKARVAELEYDKEHMQSVITVIKGKISEM